MASFLAFPIKEEKDVSPLPSIHLKRKPVLTNIPTRARFAKARPNISVGLNKASKDVKTESKNVVSKEEKDLGTTEVFEETKINTTSKDAEVQDSGKPCIDISSQAVKEEPELIQIPSFAPKKPLPSAAPRARYQKARPNIAALSKKTSKTTNTQKESGCVSVNEKNASESSDSGQPQLQDNSEKEPEIPFDSEEGQKKEEASVKGFSFSLSEVKILSDVSSVDPVIPNKDPADEPNSQNIVENQEVSSESLSESNSIKSILATSDDVLNEEQETEIMEVTSEQQKVDKRNISQKNSLNRKTPVCESAPPTPTVSKSMEYPTLKSILNSPRKRATTRKVYERKRRLANLTEAPSRSEMTMTDLIYYNPTGEPMKFSKPQTCPAEIVLPSDENTKPPEEELEEEESSVPVPKVIINENGEIIIDESSLVVRRKETIDTSVEAIVENDNTTYSSFRKRASKHWTNKETSKFYKALSLVGTDFALMESLFTIDGKVYRSRRELKMKFKREEKLRIELVHRAMYETQTYDISILDEDPDNITPAEEVDDAPKATGAKKRGRKPKEGNQSKPSKKKRKSSANDSDVDENEDVVRMINRLIEEDSNDVNSINTEGDLNELTSKSNEISRPQRMRKTRILSDYIVDVDDLGDLDDGDLDDNNEPDTSQKITESLVENQSQVLETLDDIGITTLITKPLKVRKKKNVKALSTDSSEGTEYPDAATEVVATEVSRLGRVRKLKVLRDYVTDDVDIEEEDDSDVEFMGLPKRQKVQPLVDDSDEEFVVENAAETNKNTSRETTGLLKAVSEKAANEENHVSSLSIDQSDGFVMEIPNINTSPTEQISNSKLPPTAVISSKNNAIENLLQFPALHKRNSISVENLLTDASISEVVTTDRQMPVRRARRRAAAPNVMRGRQRLRTEVEKPLIQPSFKHFTPAEEHFTQDKVTKTYSRNGINAASPLQPETSLNDQTRTSDWEVSPHYDLIDLDPVAPSPNIETITLDSEENNPACDAQLQTKQLWNMDPVKGFQRDPDTDTALQNDQATFLKPEALIQQACQQSLGANQSTTDPPPVMIFTKSPNNENILHLFVMKSPESNF